MIKYLFILILSTLWSNVSIHTGPVENSTSTFLFDVLRVRSGTPAKLGDVPYQVSFKILEDPHRRIYSSFCGGSLIKPKKILTAAHCFATENKGFLNSCFGGFNLRKTSNIRAVMGSLTNRLTENEDGQWRKIGHLKVPAGFVFPKQDICIVFPTKPFDLNDHVKIINHATVIKDYEGECLIAGYGKVNSKVTSQKLLMASVTLMRIDQCSKLYKQNMRKQICLSTKVQDSDTDKGDSGGPLVCTNTGDPAEIPGLGLLVGVTSGGTPSMKNSFFTRVTSYINYIERNGTGRLNIHRFYILIPILLSIM